MRNIFKGGVAATMIIGLAACASTPEPVQEVSTPVVEQVAEVVTEAEPVQRAAPVRQGPIGPLAGSVADFRQNVGERVYFDLLLGCSLTRMSAYWLLAIATSAAHATITLLWANAARQLLKNTLLIWV